MTWRARFRGIAERALLTMGVARFARELVRGRSLVLAYHNIVPHGEHPGGDRSLHLPQRAFAEQLDSLLETHDVVPLETMARSAPGRRPRVAITIDDAYAGAMTAGVEELRSRGLPATVFVTPVFIGGRSFWWDIIADPDRGLDPAARTHALEACRGQQEAVLDWAWAQGLRPREVPEHARCASLEMIRKAAAVPGISIGSHTWSHPNLALLASDELDAELTRPLAWLEARLPATVRWISYPYGRYTPRTEAAARAAGYDGAFRIDGGWMKPGRESSTRLPRLNVPAGLSTSGFSIRTAGLLCN